MLYMQPFSQHTFSPWRQGTYGGLLHKSHLRQLHQSEASKEEETQMTSVDSVFEENMYWSGIKVKTSQVLMVCGSSKWRVLEWCLIHQGKKLCLWQQVKMSGLLIFRTVEKWSRMWQNNGKGRGNLSLFCNSLHEIVFQIDILSGQSVEFKSTFECIEESTCGDF